jgi:uncharacterized protein YcsI (UPF0317 family)
VPESPAALRRRFAGGDSPATTAGLARGFVQANLAVVPRDVADEFLAWCMANPKPCPVLGVGGRSIPELGVTDIARELPRYRVWRNGEVADAPTDVADLWRDDLVSVALGCSYSFDDALAAAGVRLRHVEQHINPPIYTSSLETRAVGRFSGELIVAARPIARDQVMRAVAVTARYPLAHGAPVHVGDPRAIGIDPDAPTNGSPLRPEANELAVFWACGVTPETALRTARLPFAITHLPGAMLLTDLRLETLLDRAAA